MPSWVDAASGRSSKTSGLTAPCLKSTQSRPVRADTMSALQLRGPHEAMGDWATAVGVRPSTALDTFRGPYHISHVGLQQPAVRAAIDLDRHTRHIGRRWRCQECNDVGELFRSSVPSHRDRIALPLQDSVHILAAPR